MKRRDYLWRDAILSASFAGFVAVVLPLQTYLANSSLFVFTSGRLAVELLLLWAVLFLGVWVLLVTVGRILGGALHALFVALLVCAYVESGPLSAGLPEINGGYLPQLAIASRAVLDVGVWALVVFSLVATCRWTRYALHWVALAVVAISIGSVFDVRRTAPTVDATKPAEASVLSKGFEWQRDVLENFRFSPKRNVLIFILDSMPGNLALDFVRNDPAMRAKFAGFTAYANNVGMHDCTKFGLPGLVTGRYFEPGSASAADYPMSMYGEESFLLPYVHAGAEIFFAPDLLPYGYTNGRIFRRVPVVGRQKHGWAAMLLRSREVPYLSLFDFVVFRLVPYCAKAPFLYSKIRHDPMMGRDESAFWYEHVMFPMLAGAPCSESPLTLGVFHSRGAHPPLVFDPEGKRYPNPRFELDVVKELVSTPLRHLARLFDDLRARGLYDASLIVVAADHGVSYAPCAPGHQPSESAILWVKPEAAKSAFAVDERPTGYSRVASFLSSAATGSPDAAAVGSALYEEDRMYRYQFEDGFRTLVVGPDGRVRECE